MKFTLHDDIHAQYILGSLAYNPDDYTSSPRTKFEATVSTGYTELVLPKEWDDCQWLKDIDYKEFRNNLMSTFEPNWATLTDDSKKALIRHYVWPSTETTTNLDLLYTQTERDQFLAACIALLNDCDCNFSIAPDGIYWNVLPDVAGSLVTTKLKTDEVI